MLSWLSLIRSFLPRPVADNRRIKHWYWLGCDFKFECFHYDCHRTVLAQLYVVQVFTILIRMTLDDNRIDDARIRTNQISETRNKSLQKSYPRRGDLSVVLLKVPANLRATR